MGADTQATGSRIWEFSIKVKEMDKFSLMAGAGSAIYIELFAKYVRKAVSERNTSDYYDVINSATESYSADIVERNEKVGLTDPDSVEACYPQAVFATYDHSSKNYRIFQIHPPDPPYEPVYPFRVSIGSGSRTADPFLKNMEYYLNKLGLNWINVSTKLASQLCWLLLKKVEYVDPATSGVIIYRIDTSGTRNLSGSDAWGSLTEDHWSTIALRTAINETPPEKLQEIIQTYLPPDMLKKLMASLVQAKAQ